MGRNSFSALVLVCLALASPTLLGAQTTDLDIVRYDLALRLDLQKQGVRAPLNTLSAKAGITFANTLSEPVDRVPVLLHRLLRVEAVRTGDGRSLDFSQRLTGLEGWELYQANAVTVTLNDELPPGDTLTLEIDYTGKMDGVKESGMLYVQESLDPDFTIIRPESSSVPMLAEPTSRSLVEQWGGGDGFDLALEVTVPEGLVVASGLELADEETVDGWTTWTYRNRDPGFNILLPVAPYQVIELGSIRVYHFPEDLPGAQRVAQGITDAMDLYQSWFGPLHGPSTFAVVEIPEWHGSQALRPTIIQEATAFRDASGMTELYHEISHLWNVDDLSPITASRWNEGLATYLQDLTQQMLHGDTASLSETWDHDRASFRKRLEENPEQRDVPLLEAGERGLTSALAYRGGGLMFALLDRRLGQERLISILGDFYQTYWESGATSRDFADFITAREPRARRIVDEWFLGGTYSGLLLDGLDFAALVERYEEG